MAKVLNGITLPRDFGFSSYWHRSGYYEFGDCYLIPGGGETDAGGCYYSIAYVDGNKGTLNNVIKRPNNMHMMVDVIIVHIRTAFLGSYPLDDSTSYKTTISHSMTTGAEISRTTDIVLPSELLSAAIYSAAYDKDNGGIYFGVEFFGHLPYESNGNLFAYIVIDANKMEYKKTIYIDGFPNIFHCPVISEKRRLYLISSTDNKGSNIISCYDGNDDSFSENIVPKNNYNRQVFISGVNVDDTTNCLYILTRYNGFDFSEMQIFDLTTHLYIGSYTIPYHTSSCFRC